MPLLLYKALHAGETVTVHGSTVTPKMVTDGERKPITLCFITDTRPAEDQAAFVSGADLLICDGMHAEDEMRQKAHERGAYGLLRRRCFGQKGRCRTPLAHAFQSGAKGSGEL